MRDFAPARGRWFLRAAAPLRTLERMPVVHALGPFVHRRARPTHEGARCEICGGPRPESHRHVLQREPRALLCACSPCALLFAHPAASGARMHTIPDRVLAAPATRPWPDLGIPVGLAIVSRDSRRAGPVALYPSPVGAVEAELAASSWEALVLAFPVAARVEPDVEALAIHRREGAIASYIAPVDACYALMAAVRRTWSGVGGGEGVQESVRAFFDDLAARAQQPDAVAAPAAPAEGGAP